MKTRTETLVVVTLMSLLTSTPTVRGQSYVSVSSDIASNTTWTWGNTYYVSTGISVNAGVTLTIEDSVFVKFAPGAALWIYGNLQASTGTAVRYFTSRDNNTVGETISGSDGAPNPNDWQGLNFYGRAGGDLSFCSIEYATNGVWAFSTFPNIRNCVMQNNGTGLYVSGGTPILATANTIQNNTSAGIHLVNCTSVSIANQILTGNTGINGAIRIENSGEFTLGSGNTITGNSWPLTIDPGSFPSPGSIIPTNGNTNNAIGVQGSSGAESGSWPKLAVDYIVMNYADIGIGGSLTISPGVVIWFESGSGVGLSVYGTLNAIGEATNPIRFTRRRASGSWSGLAFYDGSTGNLSYCTLEYAVAGLSGWLAFPNLSHCTIQNNYDGISLSGVSPAIANCVIQNNQWSGITASNGSPDIANNVIQNNGIGIYISSGNPHIFENIISNNRSGITSQNAAAMINGNNLFANTNYEIENLGPQNINAQSNSWGLETFFEMSAGGNPKNIAKIFDAFDDPSKGTVDYSNWRLPAHGIYSVSPKEAIHDQASFTATIVGYPFNSNTSVRLKRTGQPDILPITTSFIDSTKLVITFDLHGANSGEWDLEANNPDGEILNRSNAIFILTVLATPLDQQIELPIAGGREFLVGFEVPNADHFFVTIQKVEQDWDGSVSLKYNG
jgi:parallel beta-helix repeat protein